MAAPASGVLSVPPPMRFGEIKHRFDPPAKAGGGFGYRLPQRPQDAQNGFCVDLRNGLAPNSSAIGFERHGPLCAMPGVAPLGCLSGKKGQGFLAESDTVRLSGLGRIYPLPQQMLGSVASPARGYKRHNRIAAKAHDTRLAAPG